MKLQKFWRVCTFLYVIRRFVSQSFKYYNVRQEGLG